MMMVVVVVVVDEDDGDNDDIPWNPYYWRCIEELVEGSVLRPHFAYLQGKLLMRQASLSDVPPSPPAQGRKTSQASAQSTTYLPRHHQRSHKWSEPYVFNFRSSEWRSMSSVRFLSFLFFTFPVTNRLRTQMPRHSRRMCGRAVAAVATAVWWIACRVWLWEEARPWWKGCKPRSSRRTAR